MVGASHTTSGSTLAEKVWEAHLAPAQPEPVERLRAGDLVHQVQVDVEQIGLALGMVHEVAVPDLLGERHRCHLDIPTF